MLKYTNLQRADLKRSEGERVRFSAPSTEQQMVIQFLSHSGALRRGRVM